MTNVSEDDLEMPARRGYEMARSHSDAEWFTWEQQTPKVRLQWRLIAYAIADALDHKIGLPVREKT